MLHPALQKLIYLQWCGRVRQFRQSLRTVRGIFFLGFLIAMMLYTAGSLIVVGRMTQSVRHLTPLEALQGDFLGFGIFLFTSYSLLFSTGEKVVHFSPSEVAFLFPAPLSRKQLLSYLLLKSFFGILSLSCFMAFFMGGRIVMVVPRMLAIMLTLSFLQLLTMNVAFLRNVIQEKVYRSVRIGVGAVVGIGLFFAAKEIQQIPMSTDIAEFVKAFQKSTAGTWMVGPFQIFARTIRAPNLSIFATNASILLVLDAALLFLAYRLDALSLETALATSEKMAKLRKNMQSKGVWQALGPTDSSVARRQIPQLPFWAGIGPVVWQKMTTTFRTSTTMLWIIGGAVALAVGVVYMLSTSMKNPASASIAGSVTGSVAMGYLSLLIFITMQNDIERVGYLKSLPIRTISIVIGELMGFVVLLSLIQSLFFIGLACFFPTVAIWLLSAVTLLIPSNFVLFAIDKLVFYIYPTRMAKAAPGDFQDAGKQMIFLMMKFLILTAASLIVVGGTLPGMLILNSPLVAAASAGAVLGIESVILIFLLITAFDRFDPSTTLVS